MKLIIDGRYTKPNYHDGISRYGTELIAATYKLVKKTSGIQLQVLICDVDQRKILPEGPEYIMVNRPDTPAEFFISRTLNALNPDVVFSPMQIMGGLRRSKRNYALILTVHDLIYYEYRDPPTALPRWQKFLWRWYHKTYVPQRLLLNRADRIMVISHTTRQLMITHRLTKRPIGLIGNAPPSDCSLRLVVSEKIPGSQRKSLVYMGSFIPYKNVATLVEVANALPDYTLHLLSGIADVDLEELKARSRHDNVIFHNGVDDRQYYQLLARATALITLSLAEGYGLPVVESMALGTPVVVSDIPIFHEVADSAALYVDPHDVESAVAAVKFLETQQHWDTLSARGKERARLFSWEKSAQSLLDISYELMQEKRLTT